MSKSTKRTRLEAAIQGIRDAMEGLEAVGAEFEEWRDNMDGTNLESTARYEAVSEAADTLSQSVDAINDALEEAEALEW